MAPVLALAFAASSASYNFWKNIGTYRLKINDLVEI